MFRALSSLHSQLTNGTEVYPLDQIERGYILRQEGYLEKKTSLGNTQVWKVTARGKIVAIDAKSIAHATAQFTLKEYAKQKKSLEKRIKFYEKLLRESAP